MNDLAERLFEAVVARIAGVSQDLPADAVERRRRSDEQLQALFLFADVHVAHDYGLTIVATR